jgi:cobalt-zinc-cadmium resistance protein CzcA
MHKIIELSLKYRFLIIMLTLLMIGVGIYDLRRLPIDAVPDITPNQVQIITRSPGLSPVEVERFITFPVELSMGGLPGMTEIRSVSRFGLSTVQVFFREDIDMYFARRLVMERLPEAEALIPPGFGKPEMAPITTGLGEIYQFEVKGDGYSPMELRSILEWDIAPRLRTIPGVVEVNAWGGELKTYEVQLDADKLVAHNIALGTVFEALARNNMNAGGAYIEHAGEQYVIRGEGLIETLRDIENIVVAATPEGTPIYVKNLGRVAFATHVRHGAVTRDGKEIVAAIAMMLMGENSRAVVDRIREKVEEIKETLPPGVTIDPYYDRTDLVRKTIRTVTTNLTEGGLLVIAVLLLLLGNMRGGLIVASAIPLSMLVAFTGMVSAGLSGNLMSLGAIDFGLIVDGSVVMIENIVRKLAERKKENPSHPMTAIVEAGREVARPVFFAVGIIIIVYLPILTLQGIEGKMFKPMALTVIFALTGSLVLALTLMPVLAYFFLTKKVREGETFILRKIKQVYLPLLNEAVNHPRLTFTLAVVVFLLGLLLVPFLGAEFIPKLDEGAIAILNWRLPSVSLTETINNTTLVEKTLRAAFPEVETVVSRSGQAEVPTDPMGLDMSDIYVILKPKEQWRSGRTKEELIAEMEKVLETNVPGSVFAFSQPIEERFEEIIGGARADVAIKLYGTDLAVLKEKAEEIGRVVADVPGAADARVEQITGMPYLRIRVNRQAVARYGINASQILDIVETIGGKVVGQVLEAERRFDLQVRFEPDDRNDVEKIKNLKVADGQGRLIPLAQLADIWVEEGPARISRENNRRRITIETNVRGRDLARFVAEARRRVEQTVKLPSGYWLEWGGQFEHLQRASVRLAIVVPLALFLIFVLLYTTFNSARLAALIFINVPMAATGGIFALFVRGMPFSISAGVGFIALFGVAVLNGVVLVSYIKQMREEGAQLMEAAMNAAEIRLRPVLMTALVASLGFVPMALSTSAGAEVQRPLATVVIGGLITSTLLTLLVLPAIYRWFEKERVEVEI